VVVGVTRTARWFAAALVALLTAWVLAPAAVPIYDGLSNPDEPYRYVDPPPTAKTTKSPTTAKATVDVRNGTNANQFATSAEVAPQVVVYVTAGSFRVPAGVTSIELTATPKAPTAPLPDDGTLVGNVYVLAATADGKPLELTATGNDAPTLQMRAPQGKQPTTTFEHFEDGRWVPAKTARIGQDRYQTSATQLGEWALVQLSDPSGGDGGGGGANLALLLPGIGLLVVAGVILAIRWRRTSAGAH
jgi:hypothetical protein